VCDIQIDEGSLHLVDVVEFYWTFQRKDELVLVIHLIVLGTLNYFPVLLAKLQMKEVKAGRPTFIHEAEVVQSPNPLSKWRDPRRAKCGKNAMINRRIERQLLLFAQFFPNLPAHYRPMKSIAADGRRTDLAPFADLE
jgi:hypothetical protein